MDRDRKDFPITGTAFPVKMKRKTLKHLSQAEKLEIDNKKMEERLHSLRMEMLKEKEERESSGGVHWTSGKTGPLASHAADVLQKNRKVETRKTPLKIKVLTDSNVDSSLSPQKREAKRNNNVVYARASGKESDSQKMSEGSKATVEKQNRLQMTATTGRTLPDSVISSSTGGGLLWGTYDEEASAKSFQDAVQAWRNLGEKTTDQTVESSTSLTVSSEVQAGLADLTYNKGYDSLLREGSSSLNYMEQMLLRKMRTDANFLSCLPVSETVTEDDDLVSEHMVEITGGNQFTGGYLLDSFPDDRLPTSHNIMHGVDEEFVVTDVSDLDLITVEDSMPVANIVVEEVSDEGSETTHEDSVSVCSYPAAELKQNMIATDCHDFADSETQENDKESSGGKSSKCSSRKVSRQKNVARQTKSAGKKREKALENKQESENVNLEQDRSNRRVHLAWSNSRPYRGLDGFFLAAVDKHEEAVERNNSLGKTKTEQSDGDLLIFATSTTWNPIASQVDTASEYGVADHFDAVNPIVSNDTYHCDSESDDDESLPLYMRPSSVIQNVELRDNVDTDNEDDMKTLEDLTVELQSLSRLGEQDRMKSQQLALADEQTVITDNNDVGVDSLSETARRLDINLLMDDFEEMERKIMEGHEC